MPIYEKEIFSQYIPLSLSEIKKLLEDYFEHSGPSNSYFPEADNIARGKNFVFFTSEADPRFQQYVKEKKEGSEIKTRPDYFGFVEINQSVEGQGMPVNIKLVSYKEDLDYWWLRLAERIRRRCILEFPDSISAWKSADISSPDELTNKASQLNQSEKSETKNNSSKPTESIFLPKGKHDLERYKKSYKIIVDLDKEYSERNKDTIDDPYGGKRNSKQKKPILPPSMKDYMDALKQVYGRMPSKKTVERIIEAGKTHKLN